MALKTMPAAGGHGSDADESPEIVAEINITPLVDIFLVLLIIFMVTSSVMSQTGVNVNLPQASSQTASSQPEGVILTLLPNGAVSVNGTEVNREGEELERQLSSAFSKVSTRLVILEGDRQALLGNAIEVMDRARKAGAQNFAIATAPNSGAGKR